MRSWQPIQLSNGLTIRFNPWSGCTKVSAGCANCYAEVNYSVKMRGVKWGPQGNRIVKSESGWREPEKWNREAQQLEAVSSALMNSPIPLCTADIASRFHWQMRHAQAVLDDLAAAEIVIPNKGNLGGYYHSEDTRLCRPRVFCASLADVFEDWQGPMLDAQGNQIFCDRTVPEKAPWTTKPFECHRTLVMQDVRDRLFRLIDATPNLDWLLLTKRPENITKMMPARFRWVETGRKIWQLESPVGSRHFHGIVFGDSDQPSFTLPCGFTVSNSNGLIEERGAGQRQTVDACKAEVERRFQTARPNLWLGVSVENQQTADERIPHLLRVPAAVRFLSAEPLLGPVDLPGKHGRDITDEGTFSMPGIDWVIVGGESGHGARPCDVEWIRSIAKQCKAASVPVFVKQMGAKPFEMRQDPTYACEHEEERFIRLIDKKGGDIAEWPNDLRVREFPR